MEWGAAARKLSHGRLKTPARGAGLAGHSLSSVTPKIHFFMLLFRKSSRKVKIRSTLAHVSELLLLANAQTLAYSSFSLTISFHRNKNRTAATTFLARMRNTWEMALFKTNKLKVRFRGQFGGRSRLGINGKSRKIKEHQRESKENAPRPGSADSEKLQNP